MLTECANHRRKCYIESTHTHSFPDRGELIPRPRYQEYYRDLYSRYGRVLDERSLHQGGQYRFDELAMPILDALETSGKLTPLSGMLLASWAYEFDPEYASPGAFLHEYYQLKCEMLDVMDQSNLSCLSALYLAFVAMQQDWKRACCIGFDQTTVPTDTVDGSILPNVNQACALMLSSDVQKWELHDVRLIPEGQVVQAPWEFISYFERTLEAQHLSWEHLTLKAHPRSMIYRFLQARLCPQYSVDLQPLPNRRACSELYRAIDDTHVSTNAKDNVIIFDESVSSLSVGWVWLRKQGGQT